MARIKGGMNARKKHNRVLKLAMFFYPSLLHHGIMRMSEK